MGGDCPSCGAPREPTCINCPYCQRAYPVPEPEPSGGTYNISGSGIVGAIGPGAVSIIMTQNGSTVNMGGDIQGSRQSYGTVRNRTIQGSRHTIKHAINCTIQGSRNTIHKAEGCTIQGSRNTIHEADRNTTIQGSRNTVLKWT